MAGVVSDSSKTVNDTSMLIEKHEELFERRVRFAPDDQLVSIRYFIVEQDLDEDTTGLPHPHRSINASRDLDREEGHRARRQMDIPESSWQTIPWRKPNRKCWDLVLTLFPSWQFPLIIDLHFLSLFN